MTAPIVLPWPLQSVLEATTRSLFDLRELPSADFSRPVGEAALVPPDSVSWRVFKNPLSLFIGAAVVAGARFESFCQQGEQEWPISRLRNS